VDTLDAGLMVTLLTVTALPAFTGPCRVSRTPVPELCRKDGINLVTMV
jgi:hypothetical protein